MSETPEFEVKELQETIEELHEDHLEREKERADDKRRNKWIPYVALGTAILAVFGAIAAMRAGALANEAMITELRSSDRWNEYEAAKLKIHVYTIASNTIADSGKSAPHSAPKRLAAYKTEVAKEGVKSKRLSDEATALEHESVKQLEQHHRFAFAVTFIQVAVALAAISSLTRMKAVWWVSLGIGAVGLVLFFAGALA